jgi:hypothetical protein
MALVKSGEDPHLGLGLRWISGEVRTGVDGGEHLVIHGREEYADGVQ